MDAFGVLAEAKMRQWERDVREGRAKAPKLGETVGLESGESLERRLYEDIRRLVVESRMVEGREREALRARAEKLQVQLAARLEKSGYNLLSRMFADEIQALKARAEAVGRDAPALEALLRETAEREAGQR